MTVEAHAHPRRILIVDDNPADRAELRRLIMIGADRRYQFEEADSTQDALRLMTLPDRTFDCVLLDQYLPDGTGTELVAQLAQTDGLHLPVVMVTVDTGMDVNRYALRAGAEDFVGKSWMTPVSLVRVIENAIERWTMARELRTSEARFRQLAAAVPQAVWAIDVSGKLLYANDRWHAYFGDEGAACTDGEWNHLLHPDDRGEGLRFEDLIEDGTPYQIDCRLLRADGRYRWHQVNAVPILSSAGKIVQWYGVNTDIDDRKVSERRLAVEHGVTRCLATSHDLDEAAPKILEMLVAGLEVQVGALWLLEEDDKLHCVETVSAGDDRARFATFIEASRALACERGAELPGQAWSTRAVQWIGSLSSSPRGRAAASAGLASGTAYPLLGGSRFLGVIELFSAVTHEPDARLHELFVSTGNELGQFILRTRAEQAARDKDRRLGLALEASEIGLWTWDLASDRVEWTEQCYRIHAIPRGQFAGTGAAFFALVRPEDRERVETTVRAAIANHATYACEFRIVLPTGETRWVENLGRVTYDGDGQPLGMLGSLRDVDDRKRASEQLAASEERLARAQQAAKVGVWDWNVATGEASWTDEAWQIFAGTPKQPRAVTYDVWLACVHVEDRERASHNVGLGLETGEYRDQFRVQHPTGAIRWAEVVATATFAPDGAPSRLIGTVQDVTRQHDSETALQAALARSELAVKSRDQLVSLLSHDLRGPLGTLTLELSALDYQRDTLAATSKLDASLDRMRRQTDAITNMIDGLLDAAVLQAGLPLELDPRPVDLVALTHRVVALQARNARRHRIEIKTLKDSLVGTWDPARLERAVGNLVSNAIKYSPSGGDVKIEIDETPSAVAVLRVEDQGIGIMQDDLARVFQWFVRGQNTAHHGIGGTGIGLAGAKEIIEQHGGSISVRSVEGRGTTFIVELPTSSAPA